MKGLLRSINYAINFMTFKANCAPLIADLICYFVLSLSDNNQNFALESYNTTSRYLMTYFK